MRGKKAQNSFYRFLIDVANLESIINNAAGSEISTYSGLVIPSEVGDNIENPATYSSTDNTALSIHNLLLTQRLNVKEL
jgi:hypothetical protein